MLYYVIAALVGLATYKYYSGSSSSDAGRVQIFEPPVAAQIMRDLWLYTYEVATTPQEAARGMSRVKLTFAGEPTSDMDRMSRAIFWAIGMNASGNAILGPVAMATEASFSRDSAGKPIGRWSDNTAQLLAIPSGENSEVGSMAKSGAPWAVIVRVGGKLSKFTFGISSPDVITPADVV